MIELRPKVPMVVRIWKRDKTENRMAIDIAIDVIRRNCLRAKCMSKDYVQRDLLLGKAFDTPLARYFLEGALDGDG
jgi:hypothetical protein